MAGAWRSETCFDITDDSEAHYTESRRSADKRSFCRFNSATFSGPFLFLPVTICEAEPGQFCLNIGKSGL